MEETEGVDAIAIVGMAGRFPGAGDVETFWANLCAGVESISWLTEDEMRASGADWRDPSYVGVHAAMEGIEDFDAAFFGMSRREAELTDPQHRVVLETVWATLEHAGYDPSRLPGRVGVFGGVAENQYRHQNLASRPELLDLVGPTALLLASGREYAVMRAAYKLGLTGPAISVNTACSTSAVATHLAVQSLLAGDSDLALAGGAHIRFPIRAGYTFHEGGILSEDGHVRPFDARARGTVMASGVAFIALKRLDEALADGDTVYAVIRGSAVNNDGAARMGFTAPSVEGQRRVIEEALAVAQVDAGTIGMLEAHGTGTLLGDPIEVQALTEAFRGQTDRVQYCSLGTLKGNVGHLDAAAGVAGVIKAALSLHHAVIPPSINFESPNPHIDFEASPFFVNTALRGWERNGRPRRAGVSSFGFGGTNAHIILEEAPAPIPINSAEGTAAHVLVLSAKADESLASSAQNLAAHLDARDGVNLADVEHTLAVGRVRMPVRQAVVVPEGSSASSHLRGELPRLSVARTSAATEAPVAFMFTGQGAQYPGMGAALYATEPTFREAVDECAGVVGDVMGHDLLAALTDPMSDGVRSTAIAQPAIFTLQYALARLWASWGVRPSVMVGHSVGELAAAHLGGVLSLEAAMGFAVARGRVMQQLPPGAMTAVLAEESAVAPLLGRGASLAAVNAPEQCVASGTVAAIEALESALAGQGILYRRLPSDRAFHSPMMDPVLPSLLDHVAGAERGELAIPMVSTLTGDWVGGTELAEPTYWSEHARRTVRFRDAVSVLLQDSDDDLVILEIGPGATLASLARQHPALDEDTAVVSSLPGRDGQEDARLHVRRTLGELWCAGVQMDWTSVGGGRQRIPLPTYPFARTRHWVDSAQPSERRRPDRQVDPRRDTEDVDSLSAVESERAPAPTAHTADSIRQRLISIIADLSGISREDVESADSLADLGLDSLFLGQLNAHVKREYGVRVTVRQLLVETQTLEALADFVAAQAAPGSTIAPGGRGFADRRLGAQEGPVDSGDVPVLPNVARYMAERRSPHPEHWNLGIMLTPARRLEPWLISSVVEALIERNDALRLRFREGPQGWTSRIAASGGPSAFAECDLTSIPAERRPRAVEARAEEVQRSLDLAEGPLFHVELFDLGEQGQRLLVVAHHFVMDQMAWVPFWEDFTGALASLEGSTEPPARPGSFADWANALKARADSEAFLSSLDGWRALPWERVRPLPLDHADGVNSNQSAAVVELVLPSDVTSALQRRTPRVLRKADLIVTALAGAVAEWTASDTVLIDMMGHGRDETIRDGLDPFGTVGFFISYTPLVLRVGGRASDPAALSDQLDSLLDSGLDFDLARFMSSDRSVRHEFGSFPRAQILFNHHGQRDEPDEAPKGDLFRIALESIGETHSPAGIRYYPIAVSSEFHRGQLRVNIVYSENLHDRASVVRFVESFRDRLVDLISGASR